MTQILNTNTFGEAKWVVSPTASDGTHTTIQSAINSASSGDTVFIREGTYTEDLTLKAGVLLTCYRGSGVTPEVTIIGNNTFTGTGTTTLADLKLQTNASFLATVSGANASILKLVNCALNITNNTGISYTNSNAASTLKLEVCTCQITAAGNAIYSMSSVGTLELRYSNFLNSGASTTQSANSAGIVNIFYCQLASPLATSGAGVINKNYSVIDCSALNVTALTTAGTGTSTLKYGDDLSGTASAISIGAGSRVNAFNVLINSTNANAITGAGTLEYMALSFTNSSITINVTTQIPVPFIPGEGGTGTSNAAGTYVALGVADTGAANAYVVTLIPAPTAYVAGQTLSFISAHANTTASTINVNGLGAKSITKFGTTPLVANDILAGEMIYVIYDGTQFQLVSPPHSAAGGGTVTSVGLSSANTAALTVTGASPITGTGSWSLTSFGNLLSYQVLTTGSGATYTKNVNATTLIVEAVGGGGAGGGCAITSGNSGAGGGGGAGGYARFLITGAAATYTYTIGTGGTAGTAGNNPGNGGNNTTFSTLTATGGAGGAGSAAYASAQATAFGGAGGVPTGGYVNITGTKGVTGFTTATTGVGISLGGGGASSLLGSGAPSNPVGSGSGVGLNANANTGGGGSGGGGCNVNVNVAGGTGGSGLIIVWELS